MITPGRYLKNRRIAARLSLDDVAESISTDPYCPAHARAEWLELMESDIEVISWPVLVVLGSVFSIDIAIVYALERHRLGFEDFKTPICVICGTTDRAKCPYGVEIEYCAWTALPAAAGAAA